MLYSIGSRNNMILVKYIQKYGCKNLRFQSKGIWVGPGKFAGKLAQDNSLASWPRTIRGPPDPPSRRMFCVIYPIITAYTALLWSYKMYL